MAHPQPTRNYQLTWIAMGSKCVNVETVEAFTRMQADGIIRWRELKNGNQVKDVIEVKLEEMA